MKPFEYKYFNLILIDELDAKAGRLIINLLICVNYVRLINKSIFTLRPFESYELSGEILKLPRQLNKYEVRIARDQKGLPSWYSKDTAKQQIELKAQISEKLFKHVSESL